MTSAPPPAPPSVDPPAWQPPPPPPPGPAPRTQLRRSRNDKMLGGVAGGLAEYSGVDPLLWRVGFVALAFAGGSGVLVYLLLWLLMPAGTTVVAGYETTPSSRPPRAPAGPRSPVPGVTIAGLLIVIGALVLITNTTAWDIGPRGFLGSALLVVGLGLVAAAFATGRRAKGGLIAVGIVLSLALVAATSVPWREASGEGVGDRHFRPATVAQVREVYRGGVGDMTLDLSRLDQGISGGPVETRIEHGVGDIQVIVPRSADVEVRVDNGLGDVTIFGTSDDEGIFEGSGPQSWSGDGDPEFDIVINNGLGDVEVSRD